MTSKSLLTSILVLGSLLGSLQVRANPDAQTHFKKVVWMVFENADVSEVLKQPDFKMIAQSGALLTRMSAETHPSQPNYIAMIAGATLGVNNDKAFSLTSDHVGDLLEKAGLKWRVYAENYPGNCFQGQTAGPYARRHVPFLSFSNVTSNPSRCQNIVEAASFEEDFSSDKLPEFSMYIPNTKNDGHDTNVNVAGKWLTSKFGEILTHPSELKDVLFILTFDENDGATGNQIYTVLVGNHVQEGVKSDQALNHISLLKMIEDEFRIGNLGRGDAKASPVTGIWK